METCVVERGIEDALRATIETALCLGESLNRLRAADKSHLDWIRVSYYYCARAAASSTRFTMVAAEDLSRLAGGQEKT